MTQKTNCEHEWMTKYSTRMGVDGVEWFCVLCHKNLDWPTVHKWVNVHKSLLVALQLLVNSRNDCRDRGGDILTSANWYKAEQALLKAEAKP